MSESKFKKIKVTELSDDQAEQVSGGQTWMVCNYCDAAYYMTGDLRGHSGLGCKYCGVNALYGVYENYTGPDSPSEFPWH